MKNILIKTLLAVALALPVLTPPPAQAAEYDVIKTFWNFNGTWTNVPATATNLNASADVTVFTDFALNFVAKATNNAGGAGGFDVVWETSVDGSNWPAQTNALANNVGWFRIPAQTNAVTTTWSTNITMNAVGYWRVRHLTNDAFMCYTSITMRAYGKPRRTSGDQ